jgi:uncharacterized protein
MTMRSRLLECSVMHHRFTPKRHRFVYRIFMIALDLDELGTVSRRARLLGINRGGLFSIRERDYLPVNERAFNSSGVEEPGVPGGSLKARVAAFLRERGVEEEPARIELITMPRVAGYRFNPISFYFCRDAAARPLAAIAEVTNTFGEVKPYLLERKTWDGGAFRMRVPKHFYVSPFSDVDVEFEFILRPAGERLAVQIDDHAGGERTLTSVLKGRARPLNDRTLLLFAAKYPLLTLKVIAAIHWHALRLYLKRVPWFPKAGRADKQRDLFHPHRSLTAGRTTTS